jgi:hypothetical protein
MVNGQLTVDFQSPSIGRLENCELHWASVCSTPHTVDAHWMGMRRELFAVRSPFGNPAIRCSVATDPLDPLDSDLREALNQPC